MITLDVVLQRLPVLDADTVLVWIERDWVRPLRRGGQPVFEEVDVARIHLIVELRDAMAVDDGAMPVVLSLLDQLHATRRSMRRLVRAIEEAGLADTLPLREDAPTGSMSE